MSTVAIHHPKDPTRPTVIRADRYDPDVHRLWGSDEAPPTTPLPDDLPGRSALIAAGVATMEDLVSVADLDEVPGIGEATKARIHEYLGRG